MLKDKDGSMAIKNKLMKHRRYVKLLGTILAILLCIFIILFYWRVFGWYTSIYHLENITIRYKGKDYSEKVYINIANDIGDRAKISCTFDPPSWPSKRVAQISINNTIDSIYIKNNYDVISCYDTSNIAKSLVDNIYIIIDHAECNGIAISDSTMSVLSNLSISPTHLIVNDENIYRPDQIINSLW